MKTIMMTLALLAGLPLAASAQVTKEDLKKLTAAGISDDVILSYVKTNGGLAKLSADDVIELKQAGASEKLLATVLAGVPAAAPMQVPERQPALQRPVELQGVPPAQTTYVYDSTPYYYPSTYYAGYVPYYYPSTYYYSSCYPRSYYSSNYYPRRSYYCSPSFGVGFSTGRYCSPHIGVGVSIRRR
jgi:hypothetical protein